MRILVLVLLSFFLAQSLTGQAKSSSDSGVTVFKSKVRLVVVDVVVRGKDGEPVSGLPREDFQVLENGKLQRVVFFEEHKGALSAQTQLPSMPPGVFTNYPTSKPVDFANVLLLDWLNTQPQDQAYVKSQVVKYLKQSGPGVPTAIFTMGSRLQMIHGFTDDKLALAATLTNGAGAASRVSPLLPTATGQAAEQELLTLMTMSNASPVSIEAAREEMATTSASNVSSRIALTLEAFQELERYLAAIPGRKNVIWLAGSFPISVMPEGDTPRNFQSELRQTTDLLTPSKIAIYPISAEGLTADATYSAEFEQGPSVREENSRRAADQLAMEQLAKDTGGRAFYNANGLNDAITRATNEGEHYYTLAYTPAKEKLDGSYRSIEVRVHQKDYKLAYRRGYYAEDAKSESKGSRPVAGDPLLRLMSFGLPDFAQIIYKIRVLQVPRESESPLSGTNTELKGPLVRYGVDFAISPDDLKFETTGDGLHQAEIELMLIAYDPKGRPLNLTQSETRMSLPAKAYAGAQTVGVQFHRTIDVPAGSVYLRTGVYDVASGKTGTLGIELGTGARSK